MDEIKTALCLPAIEIEALIQGKTIVAMPSISLNRGNRFALYPLKTYDRLLPDDRYYHPDFLPLTLESLTKENCDRISIKAYAILEKQERIDNNYCLDTLSQFTIWTPEALRSIVDRRGQLFLAYLRAYQLPTPYIEQTRVELPQKLGKFIPIRLPVSLSGTPPVLNDIAFNQFCNDLENRTVTPPLKTTPLPTSLTPPLSPPSPPPLLSPPPPLPTPTIESKQVNPNDWIHQIAEVGNSSNGNEFEKLVRRSFIQLGFTNSNTNPKASLDPDATGGAGGLDFYCEKPYPVVGECKATKTETVPDSTPAQLVKLGLKILQKDIYDACIKVIMAAGKLTPDANETAKGNQMNVMRPETLQKLVELKVNYPGAINLLELKKCWEREPFGEAADGKVNCSIDKAKQRIELRSNLVRAVKQLADLGDETSNASEIRAHYNAKFASNPSTTLNLEKAYHLLIELSSPLTGYLGRQKGENWKSDRFYFLRDLESC
jgi:hypothetical protein